MTPSYPLFVRYKRLRLIALLCAVLVIAGGGAAALFLQNDPGPFPSDEEVTREGFAIWPVDTPEEARTECEASSADSPRRNAPDSALQFTTEILGYREPQVDDVASSEEPHLFHTLVRDEKDGGALGAVLTFRRFGECWYLVEGQPREDGGSLGIMTADGGSVMFLGPTTSGYAVRIGWGEWDLAYAGDRNRHYRVVEPPDEAYDAPGHYIVTFPRENGYSEGLYALTVPEIPSDEGAVTMQRLEMPRRVDDRALCRMEWTKRPKPERVISNLSNWTFRQGLAVNDNGYQRWDFRHKRRLGSDFKWRIRLDDADMIIRLTRAADRCWLLRDIEPRGPGLLDDVSSGENSLTLELNPRRAEKMHIYFGVGEVDRRVLLDEAHLLSRRLTFSYPNTVHERNEVLPLQVFAIAYRDGRLLSADYKLYERPPPPP